MGQSFLYCSQKLARAWQAGRTVLEQTGAPSPDASCAGRKLPLGQSVLAQHSQITPGCYITDARARRRGFPLLRSSLAKQDIHSSYGQAGSAKYAVCAEKVRYYLAMSRRAQAKVQERQLSDEPKMSRKDATHMFSTPRPEPGPERAPLPPEKLDDILYQLSYDDEC